MLKKLVLIMVIFSQIVFAQQNDLTIDLKPVADSKINWETTFSLTASDDVVRGMLIEIPSAIKMVPLSAQINQTELFLQNTNEIPPNESIISWDITPEGIILLFQNGQINNGDQIVLKTMTTRIKKTLKEDIVLNIRSAQKNDSIIQYSEDIKASSLLTLKIED